MKRAFDLSLVDLKTTEMKGDTEHTAVLSPFEAAMFSN